MPLDLSTSRIVVTGGAGFLGVPVCRKLQERGCREVLVPRRADYDLTTEEGARHMYRDLRPEVILHLAAEVGGIGANQANPGRFFYANMAMALHLIEQARVNRLRRFVQVGTVCAYPRETPVPFREEDLWNGYPEETNAPYGIAKRAAAVMLDAYRRQYGLRSAFVLPVNLYGPCFSGDTKIMTLSGPKNIQKVLVGDQVYTLNPRTHALEIAVVTATQRRTTDQFFEFANRCVDFRVTRDHTMYFRTATAYQKKPAEVFRRRAGRRFGQIVLAHHTSVNLTERFPECISLRTYIDDTHVILENESCVRDHRHSHSRKVPFLFHPTPFLEFLGWYVSEGSVGQSLVTAGGKSSARGLACGQIRISQNRFANPEHHARIGEVLAEMGIPAGRDDHAHYFSSRLFHNFIRAEVGIGSTRKRIPRFVFGSNFPRALRQILFDAMMKGDGHRHGRRYTTNSRGLAKDFVFLAFLLGRKVTSVSHDGVVYRISLRAKREEVCVKYRDISVTAVPPEEVYCISTDRNHIVYAGRNGKLNWIGQCDNFDPQTSHVIPALIRKCVEAADRGADTVECWGTGEVSREFLYVEDAAEGVIRAAERIEDPIPINLGTGREIRIRELAALVARLAGFRGKLRWDATRPDGQPRRCLDTRRAGELLGWRAEVELEDGLRRTIAWYRSARAPAQARTS